MPQSPEFAAPAAMEGAGRYNRNSRVQAAGGAPAFPLLEKAARTIPIPAGSQPIVLADYGSSQGHNSLAPIRAAIAALRERTGPSREISVIHTDLPQNDFYALFQTLNTDPDSYLFTESAVFASAVGRSYFQQILPSTGVSLGWSSWAIQWLSRVPCPIPDQVQVAFSRDAAAREAFSRQAAEDWRAFLTARAQELAPGGKLVVLTMARDASGDFGYAPLLRAMYASLLDLVDAGFIGAEEARRMAIPTVGRRREDFLAPFAAGGRFAGLIVEEIEIFYGEDKIWSEYERHGNARQFAAQWAAFSRASVFPTLAENLAGGGSSKRAAEFYDRLEAGTAARLQSDRQPMAIPLAKMLIAKES
jgi:hypothetical protein